MVLTLLNLFFPLSHKFYLISYKIHHVSPFRVLGLYNNSKIKILILVAFELLELVAFELLELDVFELLEMVVFELLELVSTG